MLSDVDLLTSLSNNWLVVTSFISGVIAGNPRTIKRIFGIFTIMFGLYRVFIFLRELKNPAFRKFLLRIFVSLFLIITIIFFVIATSGCAVIPNHNTVVAKEFPTLKIPVNQVQQEQQLPVTIVKTPVKVSTKDLDNYLNSFAKLAKEMKKNRIITKSKHQSIIVKQDNTFKSERAAARKSMIVSCNIKISTLRADNKVMAVNSNKYANLLLKAVKPIGVSKKQILKLPLNTCERYGLSFLFRLRHKGKKLSAKWLSCLKFPSLGLISADKRSNLVKLANTLRNDSELYKNKYLDYYKCRSNSKTNYFNKLKMGIFPSRKLNE